MSVDASTLALSPATLARWPASVRVADRALHVAWWAARAALRARPPESRMDERHAEAAAFFSHLSRRLLARHGVDLQVRGRLPEGACLLAANHVGYLDPLIVAAACPSLAIAKSELAGWPLLGRGMQSLGVVFVDRNSRRAGAMALRAARSVLEADVPLLNFPEGTTTRGDELLPFAPGLFGLARKLGVPVVPVGIRLPDPALAWVGQDTFVPHYVAFAARPRTAIRLSFGEALPSVAAQDTQALADLARARVAALI
ncbi:MAG: 1-acyl-sn-glycerol-3-phosphate acyltransferase [Myxococcales bacterium]|nr:1-acyl-sn-glycerol-3-phosphate acyltransferase [Myxococcales bacterium]MCB9649957.1 1-acyl-sn-glycerol-3-phosphate acyltransferase [Deltaproteobacteria bacterium]